MTPVLTALALLVACGDTPVETPVSEAVAGGKEHAGAEHAGAEHAGAEHAGAEHGGAEHADEDVRSVSGADIKAAMNAHIASVTAQGGGMFPIHDEVTGEDLSLVFVKIHDPVRKIEGKGYFACTDFHPHGGPDDKLYDLDFWLDLQGDALVVTETKIHKHPEAEGEGWVKKARYTFVDDEPVEVP